MPHPLDTVVTYLDKKNHTTHLAPLGRIKAFQEQYKIKYPNPQPSPLLGTLNIQTTGIKKMDDTDPGHIITPQGIFLLGNPKNDESIKVAECIKADSTKLMTCEHISFLSLFSITILKNAPNPYQLKIQLLGFLDFLSLKKSDLSTIINRLDRLKSCIQPKDKTYILQTEVHDVLMDLLLMIDVKKFSDFFKSPLIKPPENPFCIALSEIHHQLHSSPFIYSHHLAVLCCEGWSPSLFMFNPLPSITPKPDETISLFRLFLNSFGSKTAETTPSPDGLGIPPVALDDGRRYNGAHPK